MFSYWAASYDQQVLSIKNTSVVPQQKILLLILFLRIISCSQKSKPRSIVAIYGPLNNRSWWIKLKAVLSCRLPVQFFTSGGFSFLWYMILLRMRWTWIFSCSSFFFFWIELLCWWKWENSFEWHWSSKTK